MPEYAWVYLKKQDSEYAFVLNMAKFWNMAWFLIYECYTAFWICQNMPCQSYEYMLQSKYAKILYMARFWTCRSYAELLLCQNTAQ